MHLQAYQYCCTLQIRCNGLHIYFASLVTCDTKCFLLNEHQLIQDLDQAETYKYLGMEEGEGVQHHQMKVKIKKEYKWWIKLVLNSELNARNRIAAINTLAVQVVLYSY